MASVVGLYQRFIFPGYNLFVSLFSGIYQICIPVFPFDPPTQSGTSLFNYMLILILTNYFLIKYSQDICDCTIRVSLIQSLKFMYAKPAAIYDIKLSASLILVGLRYTHNYVCL